MLRCSKCGTVNADGNSYCNSCGAKLDRTTIQCPKCGTSNPVGNIFCSKCHSKLISPDAIVPPEIKVSTPDTPVKGISLPTRSTVDDETVVPDWRQELTADIQHESNEEDLENDNASSDDDETSEEPLNWLSQLAGESDSNSIKSDKQNSMSEDIEATPETELPEWLSALTDVQESVETLPSPTPDSPEWLSDLSGEAGNFEDESATQALPDWLKPSIMGASEIQEPQNNQETGFVTDDEPSVIHSEGGKDNKDKKEVATSSETETPFIPEIETQPGPDTLVGQVDADIELKPDWLSIPISDEELQEASSEQDIDESEIPEWISALGEDTHTGEEPSTPKLSSETILSNDNLPSWLSDIEMANGEGETSQSVFTEESEEVLDAEEPPSNQPTWLDEVIPSAASIAMKPAAPAFIPSEEIDELQPNIQDEDIQIAEEETIPAWLEGLRFPAPDEISSDTGGDVEIPVQSDDRKVFEGQMVSDIPEDIVPAEVPEWLQYLKPSTDDTWPSFATPATTTIPESEIITPAEVPDWVQTLKPQPGEQPEKPVEGLLPAEPADIEGPLATLKGVLPSTTIVDMPSDYQAHLDKIPENVIHQAQLWQQLLGRPRSTTRTIKHPTRKGDLSTTILRIIVTVIVILGSAVALWVLPSSNFSTNSSRSSTPKLQALIESVDELRPGENVIVAFEFGWAQAEEMTAIADTVLAHLSNQNVNIIAVSTLPEGSAMIPGFLDRGDLDNALSEGSTYLSGSVSGIANLLSQPDQQSASMLIVFSTHYERIRWWIEQNQIQANVNKSTPLMVNLGLSASVRPLALPYLSDENTNGWMVGYQDSLRYQALRGLQDSEALHILDILLLMHWVGVVLLVIGFLISFVSSKNRKT